MSTLSAFGRRSCHQRSGTRAQPIGGRARSPGLVIVAPARGPDAVPRPVATRVLAQNGPRREHKRDLASNSRREQR